MSDQWQPLTLGQMFPGPNQSITLLRSRAQALQSRNNALLSQINSRASALNSLIGDTTTLADALAASGFYLLTLEPATGGWATRAQAAASAPPNSGASAGILIVAQAPSPAALAASYAKLNQVLTIPTSPL